MKRFLYALAILLSITGCIFGISLWFQRGLPTYVIIVLCGAAILGASTFISGLNDAYDFVGKVLPNLEPLGISRKDAKSILHELEAYGADGVKTDLFLFYLERTIKERNIQGISAIKLYEKLHKRGLIEQRSGTVIISRLGK